MSRRSQWPAHVPELIGYVVVIYSAATLDKYGLICGLLLIVFGVANKILAGIRMLVGVHKLIAESAMEFAAHEAAKIKEMKP